jgi:hypothetical protein
MAVPRDGYIPASVSYNLTLMPSGLGFTFYADGWNGATLDQINGPVGAGIVAMKAAFEALFPDETADVTWQVRGFTDTVPWPGVEG